MRSSLRFLKREQIICVICSVRNNRKIIEKFCEQEKILDYFEKIYLQDNIDLNITINNLQKRIFIKTRLIKKIKNLSQGEEINQENINKIKKYWE